MDDTQREKDAYAGLTPLQRTPHREPQTYQELSPQLDFLYRAEENFAKWLQFADTKSGGVLLVLSIGALDVFHHAKDFIQAHNMRHEVWGWISLLAFIGAMGAIGLTVFSVAGTLFPRARKSKPSLYFFGVAARYPTGEAYAAEVEKRNEAGIREQVSIQAWNLANIATDKYKHLRRAYGSALLFLIGWAAARIALSFAS